MSNRRTRLFVLAFLSITAFLSSLTGQLYLVEAATDTTGGTSTSAAAAAAYVEAFPITLISNGNIQSIGVNWAGTQSGNVRVALYSVGTSKPGTLLVQSASTSMSTVAGWQDISVTGYSVTSGAYWVAIQISSDKGVYYSPGSRSYYSKSFGAFDATWSSGSSQDSAAQFNMRVTYSSGPDFSITATPTSQNVAAGSSASFSLNIAVSGGFTGTVTLSVTSGCPSGVTCSITPNSINTFPNTAVLSVPTLITTTGNYNVVVTATDGTITHTVSVTVTVAGATSYTFSVRPGATQIVVTVSWTGTASATVTIAGPGGSPTLSESGAIVYDRTSIVVSGGSPTYASIHRVTFTITAPTSTQTWSLLLSISGTSTYNVTVEVS